MIRIDLLVTIGALTLFASVSSMTATASELTGEQLIQQEQQRQNALRREIETENSPFTVIPRAPLPGNSAIAEAGPCFDIKNIIVDGVDLFPVAHIQQIFKPYLNRCLAANHINELIRSITNLYLDAGYITSRAYLPNQNLTHGQLKIVVVEGFVESVQIEGASAKRLRSAFPGIEGKKLNLRSIEQGIDAIGRGGAQAKVDFLPGSKLGATRLLVKVKNQPKRQLTLGVDNEGAEATGTARASMTYAWNNPVGFNDLLWFNYQSSALGSDNKRKATSLSLSYSIPYGKWLETLSINQYEYQSWVSEAVVPFDTSGGSVSFSLDTRYLLWRNQTGLAHLGLRLKQQDTDNRVSNQHLVTSSRKYSLANAYASYRHVGQRQEWQGELSVYQGLGSDQQDLGSATPDEQFHKWTLDASYLKRSQWQKLPLTWSSQWQLQQSDDRLYASEQLSLGGRYSVRGFAKQSVQGGTGFFARNSLSTVLAGRVDGSGYWQPSISLDYGRLKSGETLCGAAVGINFAGRQLQLQIEIAKALQTGALQEEGVLTEGSMSLSWRW